MSRGFISAQRKKEVRRAGTPRSERIHLLNEILRCKLIIIFIYDEIIK